MQLAPNPLAPPSGRRLARRDCVPLRALLFRLLLLLVAGVSLAACANGHGESVPSSLPAPGSEGGSAAQEHGSGTQSPSTAAERVALPAPQLDSDRSLEEALAARRSVRRFSDERVPMEILGQLLWAAQGITDADRGLRTSPSAGARYPLEVQLVVADMNNLTAGVWRYVPLEHGLRLDRAGDRRGEIVAASSSQDTLAGGDALIVISAVDERTRDRYGDRTDRYIAMEAGHAAQNLLLQASSLGVGAVVVGAFDDDALARALALDEEKPLYIIPIGWPAEN
ncbi:MAG: SagB/ThcOx family dehydrogenase [Deltaproteobacteria bacterium]|nr:MAG: SagB/ThcOx family dehydrogenase [Deltaproteobacteria bacterium]